MYAPAHPLGQQTTSELSEYRKQLEKAIPALKDAPVVAELQRRLAEVRAEEESRASIVQASRVPRTDPNEHHSA
jgi:hypothetical protein